jgi:hypothetical protein
MDRVQPGYVQIILHKDKNTPQKFVTGLLRSVFSLSPSDAFELMVAIESKARRFAVRIRAQWLKRCGRLRRSGSANRAINCQ